MKHWIQAFRLRTLPLAFSSILMGGFLAAASGSFSWSLLGLCLLTTLFLQILSNLANDYGDAASGVDGSQRTGPKRTVSSGQITQQQMFNMMVVMATLALVSGIRLILVAFGELNVLFFIFLALGLGAIAAAIKYTVGKNPYGYAGLGDLFVLIFFGIVGVGGTYFLFVQSLDPWILLPAFSGGLLAVGVLNVNNIRDIESDSQAGKRSLPVRMGRTRAVYYHWFLLSAAVVCALVFVLQQDFHWSSFLFLLVTPLLVANARAVHHKTTASELDPYLRQLALTTLFFVLLFGLGQISFGV